MAALFVILFVLGWNQYLWPLLVTTDPRYYTVVMGIKRMAAVADSYPQWNLVMAGVVLALVPPVLVVLILGALWLRRRQTRYEQHLTESIAVPIKADQEV